MTPTIPEVSDPSGAVYPDQLNQHRFIAKYRAPSIVCLPLFSFELQIFELYCNLFFLWGGFGGIR